MSMLHECLTREGVWTTGRNVTHDEVLCTSNQDTIVTSNSANLFRQFIYSGKRERERESQILSNANERNIDL